MKAIYLKGPDAQDFLPRVTSGLVKGLAVGEGAPGALLTGQSRMIAQFDLLRLGELEFLLAAPAACSAALKAGLEKLQFAEDFLVEEAGVLSARPSSSGKREGKFLVERGPIWPSPVPGFEYFLSEQESFPEDWDFARIGALFPCPQDWSPDAPALEAGMLFAVDRFKGCYPGQEVVERSLNVGHPARVLVAMEGKVPLTAGAKVALEEGGEGMVTSTAIRGGICRAFVRVPWAKRESVVAGCKHLRG